MMNIYQGENKLFMLKRTLSAGVILQQEVLNSLFYFTIS